MTRYLYKLIFILFLIFQIIAPLPEKSAPQCLAPSSTYKLPFKLKQKFVRFALYLYLKAEWITDEKELGYSRPRKIFEFDSQLKAPSKLLKLIQHFTDEGLIRKQEIISLIQLGYTKEIKELFADPELKARMPLFIQFAQKHGLGELLFMFKTELEKIDSEAMKVISKKGLKTDEKEFIVEALKQTVLKLSVSDHLKFSLYALFETLSKEEIVLSLPLFRRIHTAKYKHLEPNWRMEFDAFKALYLIATELNNSLVTKELFYQLSRLIMTPNLAQFEILRKTLDDKTFLAALRKNQHLYFIMSLITPFVKNGAKYSSKDIFKFFSELIYLREFRLIESMLNKGDFPKDRAENIPQNLNLIKELIQANQFELAEKFIHFFSTPSLKEEAITHIALTHVQRDRFDLAQQQLLQIENKFSRFKAQIAIYSLQAERVKNPKLLFLELFDRAKEEQSFIGRLNALLELTRFMAQKKEPRLTLIITQTAIKTIETLFLQEKRINKRGAQVQRKEQYSQLAQSLIQAGEITQALQLLEAVDKKWIPPNIAMELITHYSIKNQWDAIPSILNKVKDKLERLSLLTELARATLAIGNFTKAKELAHEADQMRLKLRIKLKESVETEDIFAHLSILFRQTGDLEKAKMYALHTSFEGALFAAKVSSDAENDQEKELVQTEQSQKTVFEESTQVLRERILASIRRRALLNNETIIENSL